MKIRVLAQTTLLLACAAALMYAGPARSSGAINVVATPAFDGNYVPGTWLPIALSITNSGPPIHARISAELPGTGSASYVQERQLAGGEAQRFVLYMPMEQVSREVRLTVADGDSVLAEQTLTVRPRADERMLGIVAGADPRLILPRREDLASLPFTAVQIAPADLPDRAAGLGSLGLLLVNAIPPDSLSPGQINALLAWVSAGGHLVLGGGPGAQAAAAWLPAELRAATSGARLQLDDAPLAALAGAAGPGALPAARLVALPGGVATGQANAPAWVARPVGNGLVTQLAFDPGLPNIRNWAAAPSFWDKLLRPAIMISTPLGLQTSAESVQEQILAGALSALPTVAQPPVDWFFVILIIYAILIGPGLALGLRRIDRQAWSWLIVPAAALGCGALLLALALNLRADSRVISQIGIVEYLGAGQARARTFVGIMAPQDQTLTASLPADALARPVRGTSGIYGDVGGVGGPIMQESTSLPLHVSAWHLQGLLVDAIIPMTSVDAEIALSQDGTVVKVRNTGPQPLYDVVAVYGSQVVRLGDVRPNEEASGRWPPNILIDSQSNSLSSLVLSDVSAAPRAGQAADRRDQVRRALIDSAVARGPSGIDPGPLVMAWMDQSPLDVAVNAGGAARQSQTLLVVRPRLRGSGAVSLPNGWLRADPAASQRSICAAGAGVGIDASPAPATITLRLPADLTPLRASSLTLNLSSTKTWPSAGITTELYSWEQGTWVKQPYDGPGDLSVAEPGRYLAQGRLLLRLSGPIERAGCLSMSAKLQGTLP
jgi:hypothetical protein